jgi:co-chaperonin GroES (HSP10)
MTKAAYAPHKVQSLRPLKDTVLVTDMVFKERKLNSGLILLNDNGTTAGIRPRWGRIYAVGPEQKDYSVGDWICVAHGRWTRGVDIEDAEGNTVTIRKVDPKDILLISDEQPSDDTMSDAVQVTAQKR